MVSQLVEHQDFIDAQRGFVGTTGEKQVLGPEGSVVWDFTAFDYLGDGPAPTVNGRLWRQAKLNAVHGLFEVVPGVYQVRGFDLANVTFIEGDEGVFVVDPLTSAEAAAAAFALYRQHRGDRAVTGVMYTHSHIDHFAGVGGILPDGAGDVPVIAPQGFLAEAVSENVYAGPAMQRRATYMSGGILDKSSTGQVSAGLGPAGSVGTVGLIAPTLDIVSTGQEVVVDGIRMVFQLTPGTEAPAEMNFYLPDHRALCMAENTCHTMHNVQTLRGALVRDARIWAHYINESIELFAADSDVVFASHHWPTWGTPRLTDYLVQQRDTYAYLHDQTLRLLNQGLTGIEIAEVIELPPALNAAWHVGGFYGSVSHNVKAIYDRYLGWFDGNPTSLWEHPPQAAGERYVEALGGLEATIAKGREYAASGDLRFAAELLKHAVFAAPDSGEAAAALASVYEQLGFGAENAIWRNFYLSGATELRDGVRPPTRRPFGSSMASALTVEQLLTGMAIRVDGLRAAAEHGVIDWVFTDEGLTYRTELSNGVLVITPAPRRALSVDLTVTLTKRELLTLVAGGDPRSLTTSGDAAVLDTVLGLLTLADASFPIVTP